MNVGLPSLALISLSGRVNLRFAEIEGVSAFDAGNHQVLDADVREGAAGHDAVVSAARAVAVEIIRGHAVLKEEFPGRTGLLDGTRRADVIGGDRIAKDAKRRARP